MRDSLTEYLPDSFVKIPPSGAIAYSKPHYFSHFFHSLFLFLKIQVLFQFKPSLFLLRSTIVFISFFFSLSVFDFIILFCYIILSLVRCCLHVSFVFFIHSNIDIFVNPFFLFLFNTFFLTSLICRSRCLLTYFTYFLSRHFFPSRILLSFSFGYFWFCLPLFCIVILNMCSMYLKQSTCRR